MQITRKTAIEAAFGLLIFFSSIFAAPLQAADDSLKPSAVSAKNVTDNGLCARGMAAWSNVDDELIVDPRSLLTPSQMVEAKLQRLSKQFYIPLSMMRVIDMKPRFHQD